MNGTKEDEIMNMTCEDLEQLSTTSNPQEVERAIHKYSTYLDQSVKCLQKMDHSKNAPLILDKINDVMQKAWAVPTHGHELGLFSV
jgi:hypothetical protein